MQPGSSTCVQHLCLIASVSSSSSSRSGNRSFEVTGSPPPRTPWSPVLIWGETFWAVGGRRGEERRREGGRGGRWVDTREAGGETVSTRSPFLIRTCLEFRPLSWWRASLFAAPHLSTLSWALGAPLRSCDRRVALSAACCSSRLTVRRRFCGVFSAIIGDQQWSGYSLLPRVFHCATCLWLLPRVYWSCCPSAPVHSLMKILCAALRGIFTLDHTNSICLLEPEMDV